VDEQSIWKKEISFRRRKPPVRASGPGEGVTAEPGGSPAPADAEPQSIWKKEISFRRKPAEPQPETTEAQAEDQAETFAALDLVQAYASPTDPADPAPPVETPSADAEHASEAAATIELFALPSTEPSPATEAEAERPTPPAADEAEPAAPANPPTAVLPPAASSSSVPAPAPVVVHPPVPAAELPPLPAEPAPERKKKKEKKENGDGRTPFYRRELSFGRKPKAESSAAAVKNKEKKEKAPRPRRSLMLPSLPARGSGGGGKGAKRIVGLKIGASQLSAAAIANNGHAEVLQVARTPLDPGIVAGGELRDPDALAEALKEFFGKNKLPKRGVRLGIATNRIGVRTLEIVGIDDPKQLANAIRFRAQEALPIPIDEAVLDYQVLGESTNAEGESVRKILLVLAYRDLVDRYVAACRKAGIGLVGIDLEAFALLRALAAPREEGVQAGAALVAVTVGHDRTTFAVSDGRVCEFTRVLDWGGAALSVALARVLEKAPSEVDEVKHQLTLDGSEVPEELTPEQAHACREALKRQVQTFARELVSSLQFYQNQPGSLGIGEIVITGGTAHLSGFAADLERLIGVRVRVGDPLVRVTLGKKFKEPDQLGSLAVAIGLGIED
jgi:type IV pilus assembly protein PilM